ncbi:hypothetical protein J3L16_09815 [Alteromonas sp. 5E99-2]|uniref:DUF6065 family protein n=1 Tax=Alteromonas sp. 5E99-2 TaxID=2817683 RepID=UPI001A987FD5|nr:DUF6065 family protein [Alteromonas sp. 5E99-2]MBO1255980.1 hypothetical protein [Alteromonas sp. 5E99-2]
MSEVQPVSENTLVAYALPGTSTDVASLIRPCKITREWMDQTPARYAYRCIPLTAANSMGWELLNPVDVEITWTGKENGDQLKFNLASRHPFGPTPHFGGGTVTWYLPFLFRTPADYGLLISGPANHDKCDVTPLDAFVRTDWVPFPFTMNWRITTENKPVVFKAGEPICRIMPFPLTLLNDTKLEIRDMSDDPAFTDRVNNWMKERENNYKQQKLAEQKWASEGKKPELKELWNSQYAKGEGSDIGEVAHQNIYKCAEPTDIRKT